MKKLLALAIVIALVATMATLSVFAAVPHVEGNLLDDSVAAFDVEGDAPWGHFWSDDPEYEDGIDFNVSHTDDGSGALYLLLNEPEVDTPDMWEYYHDCFNILGSDELEEGKTYRVSVWVKTTADWHLEETFGVGALITFGDYARIGDPLTTASTEWTKIEATFTYDEGFAAYAEEQASAGRNAITLRNWGAAGGVWFDDVAVVEVTDTGAPTGDASIIAAAVITVALAAAVVFTKKRSEAR